MEGSAFLLLEDDDPLGCSRLRLNANCPSPIVESIASKSGKGDEVKAGGPGASLLAVISSTRA